MASWLNRATNVFRKPPPPAPEPFNVRCDCGGYVIGERVTAAQRPSCPDCGRPVFVLPVNVYPATARKPSTKPSAPVKERSRRQSTATAADQRAVATANPQPIASRPEGILLEARTRILTPFRLIVAVIVVIGSLTAWGLWHRHRVESARSQVLAANAAGMKALDEGDFATAARELTRARDAVDLLGRTDHEADSIRRFCREAVAGHELSDSGLFEVLADYAADRRFPPRHHDAWLVLDAVMANPEVTDRPCQLDMPLLVDGMKFRIEVDSPVIRDAARREQSSGWARVIFAAQMSEIRPPSDTEPEAVLVLKSAFLWTTLETYAALGYAEDRAEELTATRELLVRQLNQGKETP